MRIPTLSFFTGGGFLDMGFELEGFDTVWINENNDTFRGLYEEAHPVWLRKQRINAPDVYIEDDSVENLRGSAVLRQRFGRRRPSMFGMIGGPPCPDFSNAGLHHGHNGINGRLTKTYVKLICDIRPTFFVLENVAGLARFQKHREFLERMEKQIRDAGFVTEKRILNALEYGVPQFRERLFVVGVRTREYKKYVSCKNLIPGEPWFPWPTPRYVDAATSFDWPGASDFGGRPRKPKEIPSKLCVHSCLIPDKDQEKVPNARDIFRAYSGKFYEVGEGDTSQKSFKRLHRYRYSPTACYGNNEVHLHPWKPRRISLLEAMRIQGIPDSYIFPEDVPLTPAFKVVSNGVPVPLARYVARSLRLLLEEIDD
jgi:DNA (cytosine-5)-methyltransferase 1